MVQEEYIQLHHFLSISILSLAFTLNDDTSHATGEPTSLIDSDGRADIPLKDISTGAGARRSGTGVTIGGVAPDGVGEFTASRFPAL